MHLSSFIFSGLYVILCNHQLFVVLLLFIAKRAQTIELSPAALWKQSSRKKRRMKKKNTWHKTNNNCLLDFSFFFIFMTICTFIHKVSTFNLLHILSFIRTKVVTIGSNFDAILCFRSNHTLLKWITSMANHINQSTEEMTTSVPVHHGRFQLQINIYPNSFVEFWAAI